MILLLGIVLLGKNVESYNDITSREGLCNNRQKMLTLIMISRPERASVITDRDKTRGSMKLIITHLYMYTTMYQYRCV